MIILQAIIVEELLSKIEHIIDSKLMLSVKEKELACKYLTRKEVAVLLRISLPTLHEWAKIGLLPYYLIGCMRLYKSNEIDQAITGSKHKAL